VTKAELVAFLRSEPLGVVSTVDNHGRPESALVGIAVTEFRDALELVFDTDATTRKVANLRANPRVAIVVGGWGAHERTAQLEGIADELVDDRLREVYFAAHPSGRERAAIHIRVTITWARFSDFDARPPLIAEVM
jgi:pyridoxine/pyridoxamine 5'-phosphate oxidase